MANCLRTTNSTLLRLCEDLTSQFETIPTQRRAPLGVLSAYLLHALESRKGANLVVVCTHNSRRSHLAQLWLALAADYYQIPNVNTFSGGTEATAFNPRAVAAVQRAGFEVEQRDTGSNPVYAVRWTNDDEPYLAFSKKYDAVPNPPRDFAALMVCSEADADCPYIPGCDTRIALPFDDPKAFDDTELEAVKYDERLRDIGREMLFVMCQVACALRSPERACC